MNLKVVSILIFISLLVSSANALSISPAKISADLENNTFEITAINNSEQPVTLSVVLEDLNENQVVLSAKTLNVEGKSSAKVSATFYDNVFAKNAKICFLEGDLGEENIGAALKVCTSVDVVTTINGEEAVGEPVITESAIKALVESLKSSLERLNSKVEFAGNSCYSGDIENISVQMDSIREGIANAEQLIGSEELVEAGVEIEKANRLLQETDLSLPSIALVSEIKIAEQAGPDEIASLVDVMGISDEGIVERIISTTQKFSTSKTLQIFRFTDRQTKEQAFAAKNTSSIVNPVISQTQEVYVLDRMPDFVEGFDIYGNDDFEIVSSSPVVVQWYIPGIAGSGTQTITYCIGKEISQEDQNELRSIVLSGEPLLGTVEIGDKTGRPCKNNSACDDGNLCTIDACENNLCLHTNIPEGAACGTDKVCSEGICKAPGAVQNTGTLPPISTDMIVIGLVVLSIIGIIAVAYFKLSKTTKPKAVITMGPSIPHSMDEENLRKEISARLKNWIDSDSEVSVESVRTEKDGFSAIASVGKSRVSLKLNKDLELESVDELK